MQGQLGSTGSALPNELQDDRRCSRNLLPLPSVHVDSRSDGRLSRRCRQREGKRIHFQQEVGRTVSALNDMSGAGNRHLGSNVFSGAISTGQHRVFEFIEDAVDMLGPPGSLSGPEALEALRVSSGYEDVPTS